jgi:hypothetical protein
MDTLADYLITLETCRQALPPETNQVHYARLRKIERIVRRSFARRPLRRRRVVTDLEEQGYENNDALGG